MLSKRLSTMLLSGAAVAGLGVTVANAGLIIDVRAVTKNGVAVTNPKLVTVSPGDTMIFRVFADVTGSNAQKFQTIQSLSGSFLSTGGILGNLAPPTGAGITPPFGGSGSSAGTASDLDGDGDLDIGSNTPSDPAGFFAIRSGNLTGPHSTDAAGNSVFTASGSQPTAIPGGTEYRIVTTLRMNISATGANTIVNYRARNSTTGGFWSQDADETSTVIDNGDGTFSTAFGYSGGQSFTDTSSVVGQGVTLTAVPEPATLGLAALAGLGMLARRRK
jgi:hypothetical protein